MKRSVITIALLFLLAGVTLRSGAQVMDSPPRDGIFDKIHTVERKPIPYSALREADVIWSNRIWRAIDLRQKINQPFYYPENPHNGWRNLMTVIMDALKEGTISAYQISPTDEFTSPLTYEEILGSLERTDTVQLVRPYPPYDMYDTVMTTKFNPMDIKMFRLKEDVYFDKQRSEMGVRIIGLCPVRDNFGEDGVFRGKEPLFWVYFPEIRQILAKAEVFNRFNDAERRTYEDIFWKRMFDSYIIKEKNVYDRKIADYAIGLDALLESERIQDELFKFEHDLWEF
ncbi:MAG TPA: gliding motility protein GldN [Bacteroidales bacterium]|nr:gliding motility protein GldN [Bacteroidales bacterium]HSA43906.1 gliding motility protein GldN [Bacteroidales bacterium]